MTLNPFALPPVLYVVVTAIALIGWGALIFFPRRHWANFWFAGIAVPMALCLIYMYLILTFWFLQPNPPMPPATRARLVELLTLGGLYEMFGNSGLLLAAFVNLTMMDLVAGAWMTRRAAQTKMPYIYLLPCLLLTYLFAGFGFVLWCVVASFGGRWGYISKIEDVPPTDSQPVGTRTLGQVPVPAR
jgi:hypothetical protein